MTQQQPQCCIKCLQALTWHLRLLQWKHWGGRTSTKTISPWQKKTWLNGKTSFCFNSTLGRLWPEVLQKGHAACFMEPGWSRISPTSWCFVRFLWLRKRGICNTNPHNLRLPKTPTACKRGNLLCLIGFISKLRSPNQKDPSPSKTIADIMASISYFLSDLVVSGLFANFPKSLKAKFSSWGSTSFRSSGKPMWQPMTWTWHEPNLKDIRTSYWFQPHLKNICENWMFFSPGKGENIYYVFLFWNHHLENIRSSQLVITWYQ